MAAQVFGGSYAIESLPVLGQTAAPEEDGSTFEANAALKAVYYSNFTTELVFADDSGLMVDALDGQPGIYSARFAGLGASDQANNELLLRRLTGIADRRARFVCVIALARSGRILHSFHGSVEGEILLSPRGTNGFGYDPLFLYPAYNCSFGELDSFQKLAVSHRGQALRRLLQFVPAE